MAQRTIPLILREIAQVKAAKELSAESRDYMLRKLTNEVEAIVQAEKAQQSLPLNVPPKR